MNAAIVRIALRYAAGILVTRGLIGSDDADAFINDPDLAMVLETGLGLLIAAGTECWYAAARKFGWAK